MSGPTQTQPGPGRVAWVDNLRVAAIAGVVVVHTATGYVTDIADWYYGDELHATAAGFAVFALPALLGGIFGLGPLFWLAGWFSAPSLRHRGPAGFAVTRLVRLGIPLAGFVVIVNPLADLVGDLRHDHASFVSYLGETEFSVMWFVAALIFCSLAYAGVRAVVPARPAPRSPGTRAALVAAVLVTALAVAVWPHSSLLDEHLMSVRLGAWPQGAALFTLGALAGERADLTHSIGSVDPGVDRRQGRGWGWVTITGLLAVVALLGSSSAGDDLGQALHQMQWPGLLFAVLYGVVSVSFSLWSLAWFRRRWTTHRLWLEKAGRASYATYLLHPLVLTGVMVGLGWVPLGPELKFFLVAVIAVPACFVVGHLVTRMPGGRLLL